MSENRCRKVRFERGGVNAAAELNMADEDAGSRVSLSVLPSLVHADRGKHTGPTGGGVNGINGREVKVAEDAKKDRDRTTCQL